MQHCLPKMLRFVFERGSPIEKSPNVIDVGYSLLAGTIVFLAYLVANLPYPNFALRLQFMPILFVLTIFISDIACFRKGLMRKFISIRK